MHDTSCQGRTYLEVLATDQADVHVDMAQGHRAALLEVEVEVLDDQRSTESAAAGNLFGFKLAHLLGVKLCPGKDTPDLSSP